MGKASPTSGKVLPKSTRRVVDAPFAPALPQGIPQNPQALTPSDVQSLQRSVGNATVARMMKPRATPAQPTSQSPAGQAKLQVGPHNDRYEQEAHQVARQVVGNLHGSTTPVPLPSPSRLQRSADVAPTAHAAASAQGGEVTPDLAHDIQRARSGGQPLAAPVRGAMEQAFGANFAGVRIHHSPNSDMLNRQIHARAFTTGQDVFFRQGAYRPGTQAGQTLLAHELTHVVQQSGGALQRRYQPPAPMNAPVNTRVNAQADGQTLHGRLPSRQQVAASGRTLGQPQIAQRAPIGRIHRCGDEDKTTETKPPVSAKPIGGTRSTRTGMGSGGTSGGTKSTVKSPSVTKPVDTASDLRATGPTSTTVPTVPEEPRTKGRDLTTVNGKVNSSSLSPEHKARALALLENPNRASQAGYGICGLTSMLRAILISNPERFVDLTIKALSDTPFVSKWQPVFSGKAKGDQKQKELDFLVVQWLVRNSTAGKLSHKNLKHNSTGGVDEITKTKDSTEVYQDQVDFSNTFNMKDWEKDGHFATTAGGLNYLYSSVSGSEGFKIKISDFGKDWALAKSKVGPMGSINASIKGHDFYKAKGAAVDVGPAEKHPAKYRHWVVFDDVQEENHKGHDDKMKKFYRIKVWTYEDYWDALVSEEVIGKYIHSLVVM